MSGIRLSSGFALKFLRIRSKFLQVNVADDRQQGQAVVDLSSAIETNGFDYWFC